MGWPGLVPSLRRLLHGAARPPRARRYHETSTPTTATYYEGMPEDYRWFRQDELVRKCVVTNAYFATMTAGFETVLEAGDGVELGDYATMTVTEGAVPSGCGYRKDISSLALSSDTYPRLRVRLRGRGTTPQYKIGVEYTDSSSNETGWIDAPTDMTIDVLELISGKTVKYVMLYARCNTAFDTAYVDWDYAVVVKNPPLVPTEMLDLDVDLWTTTRISGMTLKLLNDVLLGVTARRYMLDEGEGLHAFDLSRSKGHADLVNISFSSQGVHGECLYFQASSSS